jgi:hypothetical protein
MDAKVRRIIINLVTVFVRLYYAIYVSINISRRDCFGMTNYFTIQNSKWFRYRRQQSLFRRLQQVLH